MKNIFKNKSVIFTALAVIVIIAVICSVFFLREKSDDLPGADISFATDENGTGYTDAQGNTYSTDPSGNIVSQDGKVYATDGKGNATAISDESDKSGESHSDPWIEGDLIPYPTLEEEPTGTGDPFSESPSESGTERPEPTENNDQTLPTNETGGIELPPVPFGK